MKIELLEQAADDLLAGARFYEDQGEGLGQYFLDSLFSDIDSLQLYGGLHAQIFGYYRLLSRRFPYAVYYRVQETLIRVYAVLDCRRSPDKMHTRLLSSD
ncbi:MAG: hypothetical protein CL549_03730 [Alcanivorax sp.]|nr:hypothetical protein [Alcanivorax sp.]MAY09595.1 hypothetical protein [Alcanivorax sp.]MBI56641.1 hypothetical protein [Alcanivorax sp.]|tara:strand:+ start:308 stop:607 length:300 start_codon:yes stop_codon:yes gene_type:complete